MKKLGNTKFIAILTIIFLLLFFAPVQNAYAYSNPATVPLGTVSDFSALAKTLISSPTGPTVLNDGDLGIDSPGTCTGFASPCTATGTGTINNGAIQYQNGVALQGQTDATAAVSNIGSRTVNDTLTAQLGGQTLTQGVYEVPAAATNLTGNLTLSGDANSVFIFHLTSTFITDSGSKVLLTGGAQSCNVFWKVDSSATFNGTTTMVGTVIASASVSFPGGGATLNGRAIAQTAAITFNNTTVNNSSCSGGGGGDDGGGDSGSSSSSSSKNVFSEDTRCLTITPDAPQRVSKSSAKGGINLNWSAVGGRLVDIEIANDKGEYKYRYSRVPNTGHMFLPNVSINQLVRVRVINECKYGDWLVTAGNLAPSLPDAGFEPKNNALWQNITGILQRLNNQKLPLRLKIPKINVDALIEFVGVTPKGSMDVPSNITSVGWYNRGPKPGETGSAVISGHLNGTKGEAGVFIDLNKLKEGDKVYIEDGKNPTTTFVVKETKSYDPGFADEVFLRTGGKFLNLITCGGFWDFSRETYNKRLVVFTEELPLDKYFK